MYTPNDHMPEIDKLMLRRNKTLPRCPHLVVGKKITPSEQNMKNDASDDYDDDDDETTTLKVVVEERKIQGPDQQQHVPTDAATLLSTSTEFNEEELNFNPVDALPSYTPHIHDLNQFSQEYRVL